MTAARTRRSSLGRLAAFAAALAATCCGPILPAPAAAESKAAAQASPGPQVGEAAKEFELASLGGGKVKLSEATAKGPVVLVVLRGYPGYQCPACYAQFGDFLGKAKRFEDAGATLLFVYPGAAAGLAERAKEFVADRDLPKNARMLLDPDYAFTKAYGLRWDAPSETAYPSTFVVDRDGKIRFAKVSTTHGGRAKSADVLDAVAKLGKD